MDSKPFYTSKTFWVNILGIIHLLFGKSLGIDFGDPATEATVLGLINIVLRFVTKTAVSVS